MKRCHLIFVLLATLCIAASMTPMSWACECSTAPEPTTKSELISGSDAVFTGIIIGKQLTPVARDDPDTLKDGSFRLSHACTMLLLKIRVVDVWKGEVGPFVDVRTGLGGGDCGLGPSVPLRTSWLFLPTWKDDGVLETSICSRTTKMPDGAMYVTLLGESLRSYPGRLLED